MCCARKICASGSVVVHLLAKEGVAGSIPVSRFYFLRGIQWIPLLLFCSATCIEPVRVRCLAYRLGRCFCYAEVSTRHPQPVSRFFFTFLGVFCVCTYIWKILELKHFPKKNNPIYKIRILTNNSLKVYNCNEYLIK